MTITVCTLKDNYVIELGPAEINASHSIEHGIKRPVELTQSLQRKLVDDRVSPSFRLAETMRPLFLETRESLGRVEVKVFVADGAPQPEEVLDSSQFSARIGN